MIDLTKKLKNTKEAEILKLVENGGNGNQDIFAMALLVNDDMQATFKRFTAIKNGKQPEPFVPGESKQKINYLQPTAEYTQPLPQPMPAPAERRETFGLLDVPKKPEPPKDQLIDLLDYEPVSKEVDKPE